MLKPRSVCEREPSAMEFFDGRQRNDSAGYGFLQTADYLL